VFTLSFFNQQAFSKMNTGLGAARSAGGALTNLCFHLIALVEDREKAKNILRLARVGDGARPPPADPGGVRLPVPPGGQEGHSLPGLGGAGGGRAGEGGQGAAALLQPAAVGADEPARIGGQVQGGGGESDPLFVPVCHQPAAVLLGCAPSAAAESVALQASDLRALPSALSVGLFFAGFLSVYGSVAYALVVYIFFNLRQIGIQLSEPFGYEPRHLQIQEYLLRGYIDHRQLLSEPPLLARDTISADGVVPNFCAPLTAKYDTAFGATFKNAEVTKQMGIVQGRFGFPGITEEDREKGSLSLALDVKPAEPTPAPAATSGEEKRKN
jgi:hypothetical protein